MKKLVLFLSAIVAVGAVNAQQSSESIMFDHSSSRVGTAAPAAVIAPPKFDRGNSRSNARTTSAATGRWYNYADYLALTQGALGTVAPYLWNDTTSLDAYGSPVQLLHNNIISMGNVWDPFVAGWNDVSTYPGEMSITRADAYTVDSLHISGIYQRNNAKTTPVDTLTIALLYGNGTTSSDLHSVARDTSNGGSWIYTDYGADTLYYMRLHYDSVNNRADTFNGGFTPVIKQILLHSTDTSSDFELSIPVSMSVPAGNMPAMSITFKSGDPSYTPNDTVFNTNGTTATYKYGMFRPFVQYQESGTTAIYTQNSKDDQNQGDYMLYTAGGAHSIYYPHWFIIDGTSGGPSSSQYPYFSFHAACPTCTTLGVSNVVKNITAGNAVPNPANNVLTVNFSLASAATASVSLTNMLGQVVATQSVGKTTNGTATFHTAQLPAGIYIYTIDANGERYVSRVAIAH